MHIFLLRLIQLYKKWERESKWGANYSEATTYLQEM